MTNKIECAKCGGGYSRESEPHYNGEILITGFRCGEDFGLASQICDWFKAWEGRTMLNQDGLSVAMRDEIFKNGKLYCTSFCHSDNGRLVICLEPVTKSLETEAHEQTKTLSELQQSVLSNLAFGDGLSDLDREAIERSSDVQLRSVLPKLLGHKWKQVSIAHILGRIKNYIK